jgi:hypothetical protein
MGQIVYFDSLYELIRGDITKMSHVWRASLESVTPKISREAKLKGERVRLRCEKGHTDEQPSRR